MVPSDDKIGEISAYDDVIALNHGATETAGRRTHARAMVAKGVALQEAGDLEGAAASYEVVTSTYADDADALTRRAVAKALINKGIVSQVLANYSDAIASAQEARRYIPKGDTDERELADAISDVVAKSLNSHGYELLEQKEYVRSEQCANEVLKRFGSDNSVGMRQQVLVAFELKLEVLKKAGAVQRLIATCDEFLARFAGSGDNDAATRRNLAIVEYYRGCALDRIGDHRAADASFRSIVDEYVESEDWKIREVVGFATRELVRTRLRKFRRLLLRRIR